MLPVAGSGEARINGGWWRPPETAHQLQKAGVCSPHFPVDYSISTNPIFLPLSFLLYLFSIRLFFSRFTPHLVWAVSLQVEMVADTKAKSDISFAGTFASSAFAACFAEVLVWYIWSLFFVIQLTVWFSSSYVI